MNQNYNLSSQLLSLKKSISSNNRQAIQKYLTNIKHIPEQFLNNALFWCIENYKVQQQTDQCLYLILKYVSQNGKIKANPNCQINQQTPLIAACKKGQLSLVRRLIQNGAKPDLTNSKNIHPLQFILVARQQNYDAAQYLINQMQTVNISIKNSYPILIAVEKQYHRIFKLILDKGSQLIFQEFNILHFILKKKFNNSKKKKKFLKQLINKYNLFNQIDKNGKLPIDYQQNQQIKTYYQQNFKFKLKQPQNLMNSSIFINQKVSKRERQNYKINNSQKRKNIQQNNSFIVNNKIKQKQLIKVHNKQSKQEDASFEQDLQDKQSLCDGEQQQKLLGKTAIPNYNKSSYNTVNIVSNKKNNNKANSSFTNNNNNNYTNNNKYKSKYSNIPSKTQSNLKNTTKKINIQTKQTKKYIYNTTVNDQNLNCQILTLSSKITEQLKIQQKNKQEQLLAYEQKSLSKIQNKLKQQDVSFQEDLQDKQSLCDGQQQQKNQGKINNTNFNNKSSTNTQVNKKNINNKANTTFTNKYKSKYSNIPSKTQSNLKNTTKKTNFQMAKQTKKYNNSNNSNLYNNKNRKDEYKKQDDKKQQLSQNNKSNFIIKNKQVKNFDSSISPTKDKKSQSSQSQKGVSYNQNFNLPEDLNQIILQRFSNIILNDETLNCQILTLSSKITEQLKIPQKNKQEQLLAYEQKQQSKIQMEPVSRPQYRQQANNNLNNSIIISKNKYKSKYSNIPSKTQSNLKNTTKKTNFQMAKQTKKYNNSNNSNLYNNKNRKDEYKKQDDKKQQLPQNNKSNFIINNKQIKNLDDSNSPAKDKKSQSSQSQKDVNPKQNLSESLNQKILQQFSDQKEQVVNNQFLTLSQKINQQLKIQQQKKQSQSVSKTLTQCIMEQCEKIFGQLVIKDDQQATNLRVLKQKFHQVFENYRSQIQKTFKQQKVKQHSHLKQLIIISNIQKVANNNYINKTINTKQLSTNLSSKENSSSQLTKNLTEQISSIQKQINLNSQKLNKTITEVIKLINKKVQTCLQSSRKQKIEVSIQMYGSRANGLQIQNSDIDLLIICNTQNAGVKDLMNQLQNSGIFVCKQIAQTKFLTNTSMPIVKLSLNSQFSHLNIDLTFQIRGHTGIRWTTLIKQFIQAQPLLKPLVIALKRLLSQYSLTDTYTGGLGSYSLTLMTIALLQFTQIEKIKQNIGQIFLQFLLFYGFQLDYICQAIIIHPPGFNQKPAFSIYQLPYSLDLTPKLIIYDPLNPVNNAGRATYRIVQLKKLFKIWYIKLKTQYFNDKKGIQSLIKQKQQLLRQTSVSCEIKKNSN